MRNEYLVLVISDFEVSNYDRLVETAKNILEWNQITPINNYDSAGMDRVIPCGEPDYSKADREYLPGKPGKYIDFTFYEPILNTKYNEDWREYLYSALTEANDGEPIRGVYFYYKNDNTKTHYKYGFDE